MRDVEPTHTFHAPWNCCMNEEEIRSKTTSPCLRASCTASRVSKVPEKTRNSHLQICAQKEILS